ncbi:MAG: cupin domain-containing protein [Alphaproteobacteria bacterium]|jgi:quercetin dioxygenase-like cupin family protein|nr:cupin domain-containing protein [Alphaproteobacteria bacterium]MDP6517902.1 cupin domain-containing protein [Alphaproteobacteria bacterium]|tara:strand:+ start:47 stop:406 length:360 start_codon:yes stop_codon:yes gene_type:complete
MTQIATRPWAAHYTVEDTTIRAETPELRVVEITLAPGETIPWHYHTNVVDRFYCLEGLLAVETRAPRARHALAPGEACTVAEKTAHLATNVGQARCRFLLVQGIGAYDFVAVGGVADDR